MFHEAEEYLQHHFSVIPLKGKKPVIDWMEFQSRLATIEEVKDWCRKQINLGIVTGDISGITVVDCDTKEEGREWWREHPTPLIATTANGAHLYYQTPLDGYGNRAGINGRKIDIRGDGGYVVAPPSIHPSGKKYEWVDWPVSMDEVPLFDPEWVQNETVKSCSKIVRDGVKYISKIKAVAGSGGHNSTFRAAIRLAESGMSEIEAFAAMVEWNQKSADPPWEAKELLHKVQSAFETVRDKANRQMQLIDGCRDGACDSGGRME